MAPRLVGLLSQNFKRDNDGYREYTLTWHVQTDSYLHGPNVILTNWPLAAVGAPYILDGDYDPWCFCTPDLIIAPRRGTPDNEPITDWEVTQTYTNKPLFRCQDTQINNPLLEPYEISGDFTHEQRTAREDKDGNPILYPNLQPVDGPLLEYKTSYPSISIKFNSATLPLSTYTLLINKVNHTPLWGFAARQVRFIDAKWERKLYGVCYYYYTTTYTFEMNTEGFDPEIPSVGTVYLKQGGDQNNPNDYIQATDDKGHSIDVLLNSKGQAVSKASEQYKFKPKIAKEGNLLLLGIPSTIP